MIISSRTPEGEPNRCPVCGKFVRIEPSHPTNDAPCPHCGQLLFFARDPGDATFAYFRTKEYQPDDVADFILDIVPVSLGREDGLVPVEEIGNVLVVASPRPLPVDTIDKLRFILNRPVSNVVVQADTCARLRKRHEALDT